MARRLLSKRTMNRLTKIGMMVALIIVILGSSLKPVAATSETVLSDKVIGIDLGTTQSVLAYSEHGKTVIIANDQGNRLTPSIVGFDEHEILIGDSAYNQMGKNPKNTVFDAKRFIGRKFSDPSVQRDIKLLPFDVVNKDNKPHFSVQFKGESHLFSAEEISAMVLKRLKETASSYLGEEVHRAVITVPAYFDDLQKQATKDAASIAGLEVLRIINEPTSAAMAYGIDKQKEGESNIIVFDLGGGTFDVSLLTLDSGVYEVLATSGDSHLGGEDFDEQVVKYMMKQFKKKTGLDIRTNDRALSKLRRECEKAKRALSSQTQTKIEIESLMDGQDLSETLSRARFEDLNMGLFKKTLKPLQRVLDDSGLKKKDVDQVVLVGGSTRIPKVRQMVRDFFNGKELNRGINPDEAVAFGASIQAAILGDHYGDNDIIVIDATPLSLGIETVGGMMTKVISRGTNYPISKSQVFSTHQDNQQDVLIQVYQGERAETKHNRFLGKFLLSGIQPRPRGVPQIEVRFEIDANGLLQVEAYDKIDGDNKQSITIKRDDHTNLSQDEIDRIIEEHERWKDDDEEIIKRTQARNTLESTVFGLKAKLYDKRESGALDESEYEQLLEACNDTIEWLEDNQDTAEYEDFIEKQQEMDEIAGGFYSRFQADQADHGDDQFDHEDL